MNDTFSTITDDINFLAHHGVPGMHPRTHIFGKYQNHAVYARFNKKYGSDAKKAAGKLSDKYKEHVVNKERKRADRDAYRDASLYAAQNKLKGEKSARYNLSLDRHNTGLKEKAFTDDVALYLLTGPFAPLIRQRFPVKQDTQVPDIDTFKQLMNYKDYAINFHSYLDNLYREYEKRGQGSFTDMKVSDTYKEQYRKTFNDYVSKYVKYADVKPMI